MNIDALQTGDILLISNYEHGLFNLFLSMIRWGTHSDYVHIALVVRDPTFLDKPLKGLYIWESGFEGTLDPQDNKIKLGVQITPFKDFIDNFHNVNIFVRKFNDYSLFTDASLAKVHNEAYYKPYDINPRHWLWALFQKDPQPQRTSSFWCSAFIGFILCKIGILNDTTDWSLLRPCDFALDGELLNYASKEIKLLPNETKLII